MLKQQLKTKTPPQNKTKKTAISQTNSETALWHSENFDMVFIDHIRSHSSYGSVMSSELWWQDF